jgi:hypothetical protein
MIKKPREIYYDINLNNFESSGNKKQELRFSETRVRPIIHEAGKYSLSIVRFQLDTISLPTYICDIVPSPNTDVNKMIETVTLTYKHLTVGPLNISWIPENEHTIQPANVPGIQDAPSEYYYGYSFRHFCDLVNNTFNILTDQLIVAIDTDSSLLDMPSLLPPMLIWNEENQIAELLMQNEYYNDYNVLDVQVYYNRALYNKFSSFPAYKNLNNVDNKHYHIYAKDDLRTKLVYIYINDTISPITYIKTKQEYSTISNWSAVSAIVFTTNTLPIFGTQIAEPLVYNDGHNGHSEIPQKFAQIVSDMATNDLCYKPNLIYSPFAENRYIDMYGDNDLSTVDITVYWKDKKGNLNLFYLESGSSATIKILFKLK